MGLFAPDTRQRLMHLTEKARKMELELRHIQNLFQFEKSVSDIGREDFEVISLVNELYHNAKIKPELAIAIIKQARKLHELLRARQAEPNTQNVTAALLQALSQLENFLEEEQKYINQFPGAGKAQRFHIRLIQLILERKMFVGEATLEIKGNRIYYDNKPIQGVMLLPNNEIQIIAEHYTLKAVASKLIRGGEINISLKDPYVYLVEAGILEGFSIEEIRRILGIKGKPADARLGPFMTRAPVAKTWLRVQRGKPAHFAIEGKIIIKSAMGRAINILAY